MAFDGPITWYHEHVDHEDYYKEDDGQNDYNEVPNATDGV